MHFQVKFTADEPYYREAYAEMLALTKFKKWEPLLAVMLIILGVTLYFYNGRKAGAFFTLLMIGIGMYELLKAYLEKKKWLKDRLDSKVVGHVIEMEFSDQHIRHTGPFSSGEMNWSGIRQIVKSKKGILIKPENGIAIYLPDHVFGNKEQIAFVMNKK